MKILLDTHVLLWALSDSARLGEDIRNIIIDEKNTIYVSVASIWEIQLKNQNTSKFNLSASDVTKYCQRAGYIFLNICIESVLLMQNLKVKDGEYVNKDPFDRILVAQAKRNNMILLTHDSVLKHYDEDCIKTF